MIDIRPPQLDALRSDQVARFTRAVRERVVAREPGQCPSGKRILPRTIHGRTLVVAEIRKDKAPFNKTHFHDVAGGGV